MLAINIVLIELNLSSVHACSINPVLVYLLLFSWVVVVVI